MDLTGGFGIPWSLKKMRPLSPVQRYIGFDWSADGDTTSQQVVENIVTAVPVAFTQREVHRPRSRQLAWKISSYFVHFPLNPTLLERDRAFALRFRHPRATLQVPPSLQADLSWIQFIIKSLLNEMPLASQQPVDLQWWGDASTSFGIGIVVGHYWAVWR